MLTKKQIIKINMEITYDMVRRSPELEKIINGWLKLNFDVADYMSIILGSIILDNAS